jgi:enediyne biosynthesis protein E4
VVTVVLPDGRRLLREAHAGSSYLSSEDPRLHFGLGAATRVRELVVRFPGGGLVTRRSDVAVDRLVTIR